MRGEAWKAKHNCQKLNERIFEYVVANHIPNVLLMARWTYYTGSITKPNEFNYISMAESKENTREHSRASFEHGLSETVKRYRAAGVNVIFFADTPQQMNEPENLLRKAAFKNVSLNHFSVSRAEHKKNQAWVNKQLGSQGVTLINVDSGVCDEHICPLSDGTKALYHDDDHLSESGALYAYPAFKAQIESALK